MLSRAGAELCRCCRASRQGCCSSGTRQPQRHWLRQAQPLGSGGKPSRSISKEPNQLHSMVRPGTLSWESQKGLTRDLQSPGEEMPVLAQSPLVQLFSLLLLLLINCSVHQHHGSALGCLSVCDAPGAPLLHAATIRCWEQFCGDC